MKKILDRYPLKSPRDPSIRKFLFIRYSLIENRNIPVCVEAKTYDQAVTRLLAEWAWIPWKDWDFEMELSPEHDLGKLGTTLRYQEPT